MAAGGRGRGGGGGGGKKGSALGGRGADEFGRPEARQAAGLGWMPSRTSWCSVLLGGTAPETKKKTVISFLFSHTHPNGETVKRNTEFLYCARALEFEPASCS